MNKNLAQRAIRRRNDPGQIFDIHHAVCLFHAFYCTKLEVFVNSRCTTFLTRTRLLCYPWKGPFFNSVFFMKIISAEQQHLETLVALHALLYPDVLHSIRHFQWSERWWIEANLKNIYVATEKGNVLGEVCVLPSGAGFRIETLAVAPEHQGFGVGRSLVDYAKMVARAKGSKTLAVCSFAVYDKRTFYEACGFVHMRECGNQYPYHHMVMAL